MEETGSAISPIQRNRQVPEEKIAEKKGTMGTKSLEVLGKAATVTLTIPLNIFSEVTRAQAEAILDEDLTDKTTYQVLSGLGYMTASTFLILMKAFKWSTKTVEKAEALRALSQEARELARDIMESSEVRSRDKQEFRERGATFLQKTANIMASFFPGLSTLSAITDSGLEAAKLAQNALLQAERLGTRGAKQTLFAYLELFRLISPSFFGLLGSALSKSEEKFEWLQEKFYEGMVNPESLSDALKTLADRSDAIAWQIANAFQEEKKIPEKPQEIEKKELPKATQKELENFKKSSETFQDEILFFVQENTSIKLTKKQKEAFSEAIGALRKDPDAISEETHARLQELVGIYHTLPTQEKEKFAPNEFRELDPLDKIKCITLVRDLAHDLSPDERRFLLSFRTLKDRTDWQHVSYEEQAKIERLVAGKFAHMTPKEQSQLYDLSEEQFQELSLNDKNELLKLAIGATKESGSQAEIETLNKIRDFSKIRAIRALLRSLKKYLSPEEKFTLYTILHQKLITARLSYDELELQIHEVQKRLENLPKNDVSYVNQQKYLDILVKHKAILSKQVESDLGTKQILPKLASEKPSEVKKGIIEIDNVSEIEELQAKIGSHIVSEGALYNSLFYLSFLPRSMTALGGKTAEKFFEAIASMSNPRWIHNLIAGTANGLQLVMVLPMGRQYIAASLQAAGVPISKIEEIIAQIPATMLNQFLKAEGMFIETLKMGQEGFESLLKPVKDMRDYVSFLETQKLQTQTDIPVNKLSEAIEAFCKQQEHIQSLICSAEVYDIFKSPETLKEFANKLGYTVADAEFLHIVKEMATYGKIPGAVKNQIASLEIPREIPKEIPDETGFSFSELWRAGETLSLTVHSSLKYFFDNFNHQLLTQWEKFSETDFGQGVNYYYQAVPFLPRVEGLKKNLQQFIGTKEEARRAMSIATGFAQEIPQEVRQNLDILATVGTKLVEAKGNLQTYQFSYESVGEISRIWKEAAEFIGSSELTKSILSGYEEHLKPVLEGVTKILESAHLVNLANAKFLESQIGKTITADLQFQNFLDQKGQAAIVALKEADTSKRFHNILENCSWGLPFLSWALVSSESLVGLSFFMNRMASPILRAIAPKISDNARPFWYFLAESSKGKTDLAGKKIEDVFLQAGSWLQYIFNSAITRSDTLASIDPLRIQNFMILSKGQQGHLFDIASKSPFLSEVQKKRVVQLKEQFPGCSEKLSHELISLTLWAYDHLTPEELLLISPYYFSQLAPNIQERIIELVERHIGLSRTEQKNPEVIVQRFYELPEEIRQQINVMTIWEFSNLSEDDQEDIRFATSQSEVFFEQYSKKIQQKRQQRLTEAADEKEYNKIVQRFKLEDEYLENDRAWGFRQFEKTATYSNEQLREVLVAYSKTTSNERSILTPSRIRAMGDAKRKHLVDIITKYQPKLLKQFEKQVKGFSVHNLEFLFTKHEESTLESHEKNRLIAMLATVFNQLNPLEKKELLQLTKEEFVTSSQEEKQHLLCYMIANIGKTQPKLTKELVQHLASVTEDRDINNDAILSHFNTMTSEMQAEARQMRDAGVDIKNLVKNIVEEEIKELKSQIDGAAKTTAKLSDRDFLALKTEVDIGRGVLESRKKELNQLYLRTHSLQDEIKKLKKTGGKLVHLRQEALEKTKQKMKKIEAEIEKQKQELNNGEQRLQITVDKIIRLENLTSEWTFKVKSLSKILQKEPELPLDVESEETQVAIKEAIKLAVSLSEKINQQANVSSLEQDIENIQKGNESREKFFSDAEFSLRTFQKAVDIIKNNLKSTQEDIKKTEKKIHSSKIRSADQQTVEDLLRLRAQKNFYLPLYSALLTKHEELFKELTDRIERLKLLLS